MKANVAVATKRTIARPLKTLIPMIQGELQMGDEAGQDHYVKAGEMLIEAKDQVAHGRWTGWLKKHFELGQGTAARYMRWARIQNDPQGTDLPSSMHEMRGDAERRREERQSKQQQSFRRLLRDIARDTYIQERQSVDSEIKLHRDLAVELIDVGYRAIATRLHPDRGGSKDAMARLNCVRDELKSIAKTRRYV